MFKHLDRADRIEGWSGHAWGQLCARCIPLDDGWRSTVAARVKFTREDIEPGIREPRRQPAGAAANVQDLSACGQ